jgi:metal transporter CNNM
MVPEWLAIVLSVILVLFIGEIIPASILTGPDQLRLAAGLVPVVYVVLAVFFPIAYPIALMLDRILGHGV